MSALRIRKNEIKNNNKGISLKEYSESDRSEYFEVNKDLKNLKDTIKTKLVNNPDIRELNQSRIRPKNKISIFESSLTRACNMQTNQLSETLIVVQVYFFEILESLIKKGFYFKGKRYIFFSSSAGQIRTKKAVFIEEKIYNENKGKINCGIDLDVINNSKYKGMNVNKYLVYLALSNTASDIWNSFDIDRTIVVEDLETEIETVVDYIDRDTFEITRKKMMVPIPHTDGCGIVLPSVSKKSFMMRLPWMKGLMTPVNFTQFVKEHEGSTSIIKDIYGKEYDIFKDKIQIIFTKSQFKMWKYFDSWDHYKNEFKKNKCEAAICNEEEDRFPDAKINYQMIQTLHKITDAELKVLAQDTINYIENIGQGKNSMIKSMGIHKNNKQMTSLQKAIQAYPALLRDYSTKETIKDIKKSAVKQARSGRIAIKGKYTFILPDIYALCEFLFLKNENPVGLLGQKEVYCRLYEKDLELDCLRSPHLSCEHVIRENAINDKNKKWFLTDGLYTSTHDFISKILQFDVDGDRALVTPDQTLIQSAKFHNEDIVPLYYVMESAKEQHLNSENLFKGLRTAFTGGNIGEISNSISKIWNSENPNIDAVKWLTALNNYIIDFTKTLYKPDIPKEKQQLLDVFTKNKLPNFFIYAKGKEEDQVEKPNKSAMNRLSTMIPSLRIRFDMSDVPKFNHKILLHYKDKNIRDIRVEQVYEAFNYSKRNSRLKVYDVHDYNELMRDLNRIHPDKHYICDALVNYLFVERKQSKKETMWIVVGDIVVENIKNNLDLYTFCESCGEKIEKKQAKKYCETCFKKQRKEYMAELMRNKRKNVSKNNENSAD